MKTIDLYLDRKPTLFRPVTMEEMLDPKNFSPTGALHIGDGQLYWRSGLISDRAIRIRQNGKVKRWKREPNRIRMPIKYGLRDCSYCTGDDINVGRLLVRAEK